MHKEKRRTTNTLTTEAQNTLRNTESQRAWRNTELKNVFSVFICVFCVSEVSSLLTTHKSVILAMHGKA